MNQDEIHPIFLDCCARESGRYALDQPWIAGGVMYATNGSIAVRQPRPGHADTVPPEGVTYPSVDECFPQGLTASPIAVPELVSRSFVEACPDCDDGRCRCARCDREHECGACDGTGVVDAERVGILLLPDLAVSDFYLQLLRKHGVTQLVPMGAMRRKATPIHFRCGGDIQGVVMPFNVEAAITAAEYNELFKSEAGAAEGGGA